MDALGAVGSLLVFFALSLGLMMISLWRRRDGGLFSALALGLMPALVLAGIEFWTLQQKDLPAAQKDRQEWSAFAAGLAAEQAPGKDQQDDRQALQQMYLQSLEARPAGRFCLIMVVLAPLAAWLRRRQFKLGLATDPGPLSQWSAPWSLVWLVVAPVFWLSAARHGLVDSPDWADHLSLNVVTVGTAIFLFQGLVIAGAKVGQWGRDPRTRGLATLALAAAAAAFFFLDRVGMLSLLALVLLVMGLLEPWVDLRHLRRPSEDGEA